MDLIWRIAQEFQDKMDFIPFIYEHADETSAIVKRNEMTTDIWIFSGLNPYTLARESISQRLLFYPHLDGASLMKVLLEIGYKQRLNLEQISIDMLPQRDVYEIYDDLDIAHDNVYVSEHTGYTRPENYVNFHYNLYKERKVEVCITCLRSVYEILTNMGIPVYRVTPTQTNIRHTLRTAFQQWETQHFKQSQIVAMLIKTTNTENTDNKRAVSYDLHRMNLDLQAAVVDYAESITGSFVSVGIGTFMIFSTRGSLEREGSHGISLLEKLALITDQPSNIGIGYGETSLAAEENARLALHHAENFSEFCAFLVDSNGTVEGPLEDEQRIKFAYRTEDKIIHDKLRQAGVTITTFNKILSVQGNMGRQSITASDVADWLKMTRRNAQRILTSLLEQGLVEIIGEEAPVVRGRPRKIYKISSTFEI